ncbi:MAG TPA: Asp-tRNA(Asn)/Glu-tRNA(Gln) amidotransferase subunit GatC [Thermoanaerobaculia bacterium]|jgi:aspartyl-tRNA(Asn)/glutamyl-tRNA(Gln) amidotransferase subunit C|nr:Asp-tRNA(Asn)/Glu-tRNA(Gln) amidotransferase subunit GatC [Thermoanaerobaculia bacterium]
MKIDREEARRIADLAHLEFTEEALERMAAEMTKILTYIDQLREASLDPPSSAAAPAATPMREDVPLASLDRELAARNAPGWRDGFFVVPKVIGGE